jgi:hypothetical protein
MRSYRSFFLSLMLLAACGLLQAARPNFSGDWKLNTGKSDFGAMPAPYSRTDKIMHQDPDLTDSFTQNGQMGEVSAEMKYSTDGKETTNTIHGAPVKTTAKWEGDQLTIDGKASLNGSDVTFQDHWSLSPDGKTLTVTRHVNSPMGVTDQKIVLDKQ